MKVLFLVVLLCVIQVSFAQDHGFPFGDVTYRELEMKTYEKDTAAIAVVLNEFGEAHIDNDNDHNLLLEYHVKIKILKKRGVKYADLEIPLQKFESRVERVTSIKASSFNIEGGTRKEVKLDPKNIYNENNGQYWNVTKFAIPNVREGSVIEFRYTLESPFIYNFRNWEFQSDIPKIMSEYWATIPANYKFNITLRGFQKLDKNESEVVKDCFAPGGGNRADCGRFKWGMQNIPAFKEEEYMTAKSNFISGINFELSEIEFFDGRKDKFTKEWKDAEDELQKSDKFGLQLKRGKDIVDEHVELLMTGETDDLVKARKIYDFIKGWYRWDDKRGKYSEFGIRKAFDKKVGNVGDINLSLVAALRYAGLNVEPLILSTRENGFPTELHPVLSDFDYVIAKLNIQDKVYLLDATDDLLPFGLIPERCLNGKGRVLGEKGSYWHDLSPSDKSKRLILVNLKLEDTGVFTGTWQATYTGYEAVRRRKEILEFSDPKEYINKLSNTLTDVEVKDFQITNVDEDLRKPLVVKMEIEMQGFNNPGAQNFLFNPFISVRWKENPFKSDERLYPVDFGAPVEDILVFTLEYPAAFEPVDLPQKVGLALPNSGGRFLFDIQNAGSKLTVNSSLLISRTLFSSEEYHYLKELFSRVIAVQQSDLVFRKKVN